MVLEDNNFGRTVHTLILDTILCSKLRVQKMCQNLSLSTIYGCIIYIHGYAHSETLHIYSMRERDAVQLKFFMIHTLVWQQTFPV